MNSSLLRNTLAAFTVSILFIGLPAQATKTSPPSTAKLNIEAKDTVLSVLKRHVGEYLYLQTDSGKEINGKLVFVGKKVVHIEKVSGRDFYDAVIDIDSIEAAMVKVRGKR